MVASTKARKLGINSNPLSPSCLPTRSLPLQTNLFGSGTFRTTSIAGEARSIAAAASGHG